MRPALLHLSRLLYADTENSLRVSLEFFGQRTLKKNEKILDSYNAGYTYREFW